MRVLQVWFDCAK